MGFRNLNRSAGTPATGGGGGGGSVNSVGVANATLVKTGTSTDPLFAVVQATAAPLAIGTQALGSSLKSAKEDHVHAHGNQLGGTLHSAADGSNAGFMSAADFTKLAAIGAAAPPGTRTITAGGGLTGGGDLSADRTLAVGAGTGIVVNADDVAVDVASAFAWTAAHTFTASSTPITATVTDAVANIKLEGAKLAHRASVTATAGIGVWLSFFTSNGVAGGGTLAEAGRVVGMLQTVTNGAENGTLLFPTNVNGTVSTTANVGWITNGKWGGTSFIIGTISALGVVTTNAQIITASSMVNLQSNAATLGGFLFTGVANTSGARSYSVWQPTSNTGITASTAVPGFDWQAHTMTWATGALTSQKEFSIAAPTYAFAGASTLSDAATLYVSGAPIAGANATITRSYALWTDDGDVRHDGIGVALGGGSAATLGTIGGSGPATAAQNKWARINIDGTFYFVPVWL